ncbi:MAG: hypothetical protein ABW061_18255 [Polyangiaceae bacterium]
MLRKAALVTLGGLLIASCGPDKPRCTGPHPDFIVVVKLSNRPLPPDTVVHVTYGGSGMEEYDLAAPGNHEVVFCLVADASGVPLDASAPTEGAAGDGGSEPVQALSCQLWTGGYSKVEVRGTGIEPTTQELAPREGECTVKDTILLEPPDAGLN